MGRLGRVFAATGAFASLVTWAAAPAAASVPLDLNAAEADALEVLPGIGPDKAAAIVTWRSAHGPFSAVADLALVPGVGHATVQAVRGRVFVAADLDAPTGPDPVDINRAEPAELAALPGIDDALAARIVDDRDERGAYASCSDLVRVDGIGPATVAVLGPYCRP